MSTTMRTLLLGLATMTLAACSETTSQPAPDLGPPIRSGSSADESACLDAVGRETNNTVAVLSSEFSQANTQVMVGVGPDRAPWRCLVSGGVVAEVESTVDEGAL